MNKRIEKNERLGEILVGTALALRGSSLLFYGAISPVEGAKCPRQATTRYAGAR